jgi:hypothetical protein
MPVLRCLGEWAERDLVAQALDSLDQPPFQLLPLSVVEGVRSQLFGRFMACEQIVDDHQDRMRHRNDRLVLASSCRKSLVERRQIRLLGVRCPMCCFDRCLSQPAASLARFPTPTFPRTLVIARTQPGL